jgi:mgtE-like transporter
LVDTLTMGAFAFALNLVLGQASLGQLFAFIIVPPVACIMAMALSIPLTSLIAIVTFRRGLDPDILVYPILASVNDIMVTSAFVVTVILTLTGGTFHYLLVSMFILIIGITGLLLWRTRKARFFYQTIKEGTTVVIVSSLFGSLNGYFLSSMSGSLLKYPGLVVLYPALTNALGNIGSIIGSTKTTSLALGIVESFMDEAKSAVSQVAKVESVALLMHAVFGVVTYLIAKPSAPGASLQMLVGVALISNLSTFAFIALIALGAAYLAFRRGLNPDNVVIPVITSLSDSLATLSLLPSVSILKIIGVI